jgi:hypothetical protein
MSEADKQAVTDRDGYAALHPKHYKVCCMIHLCSLQPCHAKP